MKLYMKATLAAMATVMLLATLLPAATYAAEATGAVQATPSEAEAGAAAPDANAVQEQDRKKREHWEKHKKVHLERMKQMAVLLGIEVEGKSAKQIHEEIRKLKHGEPGESAADRLARLNKLATRLGIDPKGKSADELTEEIKQAFRKFRNDQHKRCSEEETKQGTEGKNSSPQNPKTN